MSSFTKEDQALHLKDEGNKAFREGRWGDALISYSNGLKMLNAQAIEDDPLEAATSSAAEVSLGRPAFTSGARRSPIGIAIRSNMAMVSPKGH